MKVVKLCFLLLVLASSTLFADSVNSDWQPLMPTAYYNNGTQNIATCLTAGGCGLVPTYDPASLTWYGKSNGAASLFLPFGDSVPLQFTLLYEPISAVGSGGILSFYDLQDPTHLTTVFGSNATVGTSVIVEPGDRHYGLAYNNGLQTYYGTTNLNQPGSQGYQVFTPFNVGVSQQVVIGMDGTGRPGGEYTDMIIMITAVPAAVPETATLYTVGSFFFAGCFILWRRNKRQLA